MLLHTQLVENMLSACLANLEYGQNICPELDSSSLMRGRSGCLVHKMNKSVEGSLIDSEQKIEVNSHYLHELFWGFEYAKSFPLFATNYSYYITGSSPNWEMTSIFWQLLHRVTAADIVLLYAGSLIWII